MCGRYSLTRSKDDLKLALNIDGELVDFAPRSYAAPQQELPVVVQNGEHRDLVFKQWGLLPSWMKDPSKYQINARGETVHEKPFFRSAFKSRRCLVPATSFFEWKRVEPSGKDPYLIQLEGGHIFSMAGLYEGDTFCIITTNANTSLRFVHDRMPVILDPVDYAVWLDERPGDPKILIRPYPSNGTEYRRIETR